MRSLAAALALLLATLVPAMPAQAQGAAYCAPGQGPRFQFGFAALKAELGDTMGQPTECEHANTANGDTLQQTTTGLAFYRKSTNTPTFTDGFRHWALTPAGLVSWEGSAVDPPRPAVPGSTAPTGPASARPKPPTSFIYSVVEAPGSDTDFWCLTANPSCNRDDWWAEYNSIQGSDPVQYRFLGPALVTEQRFVEAIWLLWQWPEGASLLREAAASGVRVFAVPGGALSTAFAAYSADSRVIGINAQFTETSTWMVADLIAHELRHAADDRAGILQNSTFDSCVANEQRAYQVEARYLRWLSTRFDGLPNPRLVGTRLSGDDFQLFLNLYNIATAKDVNAEALADYRKACAP